jgi:hypothetical protein
MDRLGDVGAPDLSGLQFVVQIVVHPYRRR